HLLEIYLGCLLADKAPRVLNAGGGGAGSIQNLEVVREVLNDQPDLLVIYPEGGEKNLVPPLPQGIMARAVADLLRGAPGLPEAAAAAVQGHRVGLGLLGAGALGRGAALLADHLHAPVRVQA